MNRYYKITRRRKKDIISFLSSFIYIYTIPDTQINFPTRSDDRSKLKARMAPMTIKLVIAVASRLRSILESQSSRGSDRCELSVNENN